MLEARSGLNGEVWPLGTVSAPHPYYFVVNINAFTLYSIGDLLNSHTLWVYWNAVFMGRYMLCASGRREHGADMHIVKIIAIKHNLVGVHGRRFYF